MALWVTLALPLSAGCIAPPELGSLSCHFRCDTSAQCVGGQRCVDMGTGLGRRCCDPPEAPDGSPSDASDASDLSDLTETSEEVDGSGIAWIEPDEDDFADCSCLEVGLCEINDCRERELRHDDPPVGWRDEFDAQDHVYLDARGQPTLGLDVDALNWRLPRALITIEARPAKMTGPARPALNFQSNTASTPRSRRVLPDAEGVARLEVVLSGAVEPSSILTWHNPTPEFAVTQGSPAHTYEVVLTQAPLSPVTLGTLSEEVTSVERTHTLTSPSELALFSFDAPEIGQLGVSVEGLSAEDLDLVLLSYDDSEGGMVPIAERVTRNGDALSLDRLDFPSCEGCAGTVRTYWLSLYIEERGGPLTFTVRVSRP